MNSLFTGRRPVLFTMVLIVTMAGFSRWNARTSNSSTIYIPSPNDPNQANPIPDPAIPRTAWNRAPEVKASLATVTLPEATAIQETTQPITANGEALTLALTPTVPVQAQPISNTARIPSLEEFSRQVSDGQSDQVRGLYVPHVLALRVIPQPPGDPGFISAEDGTATLFQTASYFGVTGLLAHNFLSGRDFFRLNTGQELNLIYGDGHTRHYRVSQIDDFQRLSINDLRSNFLELSSGIEKTADQVFADFYQGQPHLTLQTCIERDGEWSWGVRFIRADPTD
jgi:hypothetical protein